MTKLEIKKSIVISASVEKVWEKWTTPRGIASFFAEDNRVEGKVGGAFEMYFMPEPDQIGRGSEGCTFLALAPPKQLSFSWNASPATPDLRAAGAMTRVDIRLVAQGPDKTEVELHHHELGEGGEWPAYHEYFDRAWKMVLDDLAEALKGTE